MLAVDLLCWPLSAMQQSEYSFGWRYCLHKRCTALQCLHLPSSPPGSHLIHAPYMPAVQEACLEAALYCLWQLPIQGNSCSTGSFLEVVLPEWGFWPLPLMLTVELVGAAEYRFFGLHCMLR